MHKASAFQPAVILVLLAIHFISPALTWAIGHGGLLAGDIFEVRRRMTRTRTKTVTTTRQATMTTTRKNWRSCLLPRGRRLCFRWQCSVWNGHGSRARRTSTSAKLNLVHSRGIKSALNEKRKGDEGPVSVRNARNSELLFRSLILNRHLARKRPFSHLLFLSSHDKTLYLARFLRVASTVMSRTVRLILQWVISHLPRAHAFDRARGPLLLRGHQAVLGKIRGRFLTNTFSSFPLPAVDNPLTQSLYLAHRRVLSRNRGFPTSLQTLRLEDDHLLIPFNFR